MNPGSGPGGSPLPDANYQYSIPLLKADNVVVLGYVSANYGNRELEKVVADVNTYHGWGAHGLGIDGIFIDEVDFEGYKFSFFERISLSVRSNMWKKNKGIPPKFKETKERGLISGFVCLNPGGPTNQRYFDLADLVIVSEHTYTDFLNPPTQYDTYSYLLDAPSSYGHRVLIPRFTTGTPAQKMGVIIHGFAMDMASKEKLEEMRMMVRDLVRVKKVGAVFLTDLDISKTDVYAAFGTIWEHFVEAVVGAGREEPMGDINDKNVQKICVKQGFVAGFIAKIVELGWGKE